MSDVLTHTIRDIKHWQSRRHAPILLELNCNERHVEHLPPHPLGRVLYRHRISIHDIISRLKRAETDDRVVGLFAYVGEPAHQMATSQELRDAVRRFGATGKRTVAWAETFGELLPASAAYYLATAFDEIHMQPSGTLGLAGVGAEVTFFSGLLEKVGIEPRIGARHEYKNAANVITETGFTDAHRESVESLTTSLYDQLVEGIADRRDLTVTKVQELVDTSPIFAQEALSQGLLDSLSYRDEALQKAKKQAQGPDASLLYLHRYHKFQKSLPRKTRKIALVYGIGGVQRGTGGFNPSAGGQVMGADTVARALRAAGTDEDVAAVVFRVDSPGGSYLASDTIWRETVRLKEAGKPLIASMGTVAGSGGYFVAMAAERILAQPATFTGSIGVFGGKAVANELMEKAGLTSESVSRGAHANMFSPRHDFTADEWERLQAWLDLVYEDFVGKAAISRSMSPEEMHHVARGRVWTGAQALEIGLVDELGGLAEAITAARKAIGLSTSDPVHIQVFPRSSPIELVGIRTPRSSDDDLVGASTGASTKAAAGALLGTSPALNRIGSAISTLDSQWTLRMPHITMR